MSLSWDLGAISYQTSQSHISETDEVFTILTKASQIINDLLHEEIDTRVQNRSKE